VTHPSTSAAEVSLAAGVRRDVTVVRDAEVRGLTGHDEEWLLAGGAWLPGAQRTTALLSRTVLRLGGGTAPDVEEVRSLTVGDRETLLWGVRRATVGNRVDLVVTCQGCGEKLDALLDLEVSTAGDFDPGGAAGAERSERIVDGHRVLLRCPTGADQEAVAAAGGDLDQRATALLRRLVTRIDGEVPSDDLLTGLAPALSSALAEADPAAELMIDVTCPACDAVTRTLVDAGAVLVEEAVAGARWLLEEIHVLAWHYHWSEDAILSLPTARRRRYLELIDDATSGERS
jgi:hypothetical protein